MTISRSTFLIAGASYGASLAKGARAHAAALAPLTAAYVPSTLFAPLFVAYDRGFLTSAGFAGNLQPIVAGQDAIALLAQGQLDLVAGGISAAFFNAIERGLEVRLVGSTGYQPQHGHPSALMVRSDLYESGLRDTRGLKGKKVAWVGGAGATAAYYVARILRDAGLSLSDIEMVNLANPDQGPALERKAIDAVFSNAPFTIAFEQQHLARMIAGPPRGISGTGIFFGPTLLKAPPRARAVVGALRRAAAIVSGKGYYAPENIATYGKYTKQSAAVLDNLDRYDFAPDLHIDEATVLDMQSEFLKQKVLAYPNPLPAQRLFAHF